MSNREVVIPVSAAFEKRLAELVWEHCPDLARQTAAGNLALSLNVDAEEIQKMVIAKLLPSLVKKTQVEVSGRLESSVDAIAAQVAEQIGAGSLEDAEKRLDGVIDKAVRWSVNREVDALVKEPVRRGVDEHFGKHFSSGLQDRIDCIVRDHLESRLSHGKPATVMRNAEETVDKANASIEK